MCGRRAGAAGGGRAGAVMDTTELLKHWSADKFADVLGDLNQGAIFKDELREVITVAAVLQAERDSLNAQLAEATTRAETAEAAAATYRVYLESIRDYALHPDAPSVNAAEMTIQERLRAAGLNASLALNYEEGDLQL